MVLDQIPYVAAGSACSSPSSTPHNSPESLQTVVDRFEDSRLIKRSDFSINIEVFPMNDDDDDDDVM